MRFRRGWRELGGIGIGTARWAAAGIAGGTAAVGAADDGGVGAAIERVMRLVMTCSSSSLLLLE